MHGSTSEDVFGGGIDRHEPELFQPLETRWKVLDQRKSAGKAVRLEDCKQTLCPQFLRRLDQRHDLGGMVRIVGNNPDPPSLMHDFKTAAHRLGFLQCLENFSLCFPDPRNRHRCGGIPLVVVSRHWKHNTGFRILKRLALWISGTKLVGDGIFGAVEYALFCVFNEFFKAINECRFRIVVLHVVVFDVGDDGIVRRVAGYSAIGFIGLDHHDIAIARNPFDADHLATNAVATAKNLGNHCRGGGFSVRTTNGNAGAVAHQCGQHLAPAGDRNTQLHCPGNLGMRIGYGGGTDEPINGSGNMCPIMPERDFNAVFGKPSSLAVLLEIAARNPEPAFLEQPRHTRHANATDAHEVYMPALMDQLFGLLDRTHA
ncbi:MAG: hypothetical protein U9P12_04010 [Verrucomicrobiota bacterium]|nr:hypothetical protein [Verrucomicrobiota bacterium]